MSARAFADGLRDLLATDLLFCAAIATLIGLPANVRRSNIPLVNLPTSALPCWVVEQGSGTAASISNNAADEGLVIGLSQQQFTSDLHASLVWSESDRDRAADQRADLPTLMTQLLLRNPMPGGIAFAMFAAWQPDQGVNHPLQVWRATLRGEYAIQQS
jgi:hypothetical protein